MVNLVRGPGTRCIVYHRAAAAVVYTGTETAVVEDPNSLIHHQVLANGANSPIAEKLKTLTFRAS